MQNEPNFPTTPSLIHPFTQECNPGVPGLIHLFIQNKSNSNRNSTIENPKSLRNFPKKTPTFQKKYKNIQKYAFCKFQTLTHLTPYTTKTYITFSPKYGSRATGHERRINMQNETNFKPNAHMPTSPNGSRATSHDSCKTNPISPPPVIPAKAGIHYSIRYTTYKKMQNEPNLPLRTTQYDIRNTLIHPFTHLPIHSSTILCKTNPIPIGNRQSKFANLSLIHSFTNRQN